MNQELRIRNKESGIKKNYVSFIIHNFLRPLAQDLRALFFIHVQKGQTLIEVLASFGVAIVVVTAITIAILTGLNNTQSSKNRSLASQYAQQGIEILRQKRDSGVDLPSGLSCLDKDSTNLTPPPAGKCDPKTDADNNFIFIREVAIEKVSGTCSGANKITVTTRWSDTKCTTIGNVYCQSVQLVSCLSDFVPVAAP